MNLGAIQITSAVRRKAAALGEAGQVWLEGLDGLVRDLAAQWQLSIGPSLPGGTTSFVAKATTAEGQDAVLKVALPGADPAASQLRTLLAAGGKGYARVLRHDEACGAMLLEPLGQALAQLGLPPDAQIAAICATLSDAWIPPSEGAQFMTGAQKARSLNDFIGTAWRELGEPCATRTIEAALNAADARLAAYDPETAVLAHGDAHAWNTLSVPGSEPMRFKLVDPDGLLIERAYDLGVLMREWSTELLAGDPVALGRRRCLRLAQLAGVAPEPIWQWGLVERTSTGLLLLKLGLDELAQDLLTVADAWGQASPLARFNDQEHQ
jgi:streptomycin 6-kinase